jgi:chromosomal replication initiator protein
VDNEHSAEPPPVDPAQHIWDQVQPQVRSELAESTWATRFHGIHALRVVDGVLVLGVPNALAAETIRSQYLPILESALLQVTGAPLGVALQVDTDAGSDEPLAAPDPAPLPLAAVAAPRPAADDAPYASGSTLNPRYTFNQFVIGASNRFAHAAALSVAEDPAQAYNPLFIYGRAGLGKTHLLHAIGHHVHAVRPKLRVRYLTTEAFMNDFVEAIRDRTRMPVFKRRYRELDVLLIDDIQFLERTQELQEEFFHTFNQIHNAGGQIVISSDRSPKSIATLEDRLRSRFEWGLITDVQPPEFETRLAIVRKKAEAEHLHGIPDEVLAFIASSIEDNIRELEGALIRVAAYSSLNRAQLSEEVARTVLADLLPETKQRVITPQLILEETAKQFGWTTEELCGKSRRRPLVTARQISMYVMRQLTDFSYPRIAEEFGGRDHTTVMYAVEKIRLQMHERHHTFDQVNELITRIRVGSTTAT